MTILLSFIIIRKHQKNVLHNQMEVSQEIKMQINRKQIQLVSKNDNN